MAKKKYPFYEVIKSFTDLQDGNHLYKVGDTFPREGLTVSEERLEELSTSANKQGVPLIEKVESVEKPEKPKKKKKAEEE